MALDNDNGMVLPVQPLGYGGYGYGNGGFGNGFGWGSDIWVILIVLFALGGFGGMGWGGFGGFGNMWGNMWGMDGFPWILASNANNMNATQDGFNQAATANALGNLSTAVASGFGDVQLGIAGVNQNICQTGAGITSAVTNGFAQAEIADNARQIANMQQAFNAQTAIDNRLDTISSDLQKCCCDNELRTEQLRFTVATENAADREALSNGIRDILTAQNAGTQRIIDKLCDQELQAERRENAELRTRLNMADLAASQAQQTAALVADNTAQTQYIVNRVAPYPIPAYPVSNPYGCNGWNGYGFGFNNGFNNFGAFNPFGNVGFGNGSF